MALPTKNSIGNHQIVPLCAALVILNDLLIKQLITIPASINKSSRTKVKDYTTFRLSYNVTNCNGSAGRRGSRPGAPGE
jgi:hypothetical protein